MYKHKIPVSILTSYEKYRLNRDNVCPICNHHILNSDIISYQKDKLGRYYIYTFFHSNCIEIYKEKINVSKKEK